MPDTNDAAAPPVSGDLGWWVEVVCNGIGMKGAAAHGLLDYQIDTRGSGPWYTIQIGILKSNRNYN